MLFYTLLVLVPFGCNLLWHLRSWSKLNPAHTSFKDCASDGRGSTGETWFGIKGYVAKHHPFLLVFENTTGVKAALAVIKSFLEQEGYSMVVCESTPLDVGWPQRRPRVYIIAALQRVVGQESAPFIVGDDV